MVINASRPAILAFLEEFKRSVAEFGLMVVSRTSNNDTLRQLGLTKRNQEDIIFGLTPANYVKGPELDRDRERSGEIWIFGENVGSHLLYIKIKLVDTIPLPRAKCISFHLADEPLTFPFREKKETPDE